MITRPCGFVCVSWSDDEAEPRSDGGSFLDEQHKLYFIPQQIYGVIRVSLLPVQDTRTAMIRVLCDMIYVINKHKDNLSVFENEFVSVMDRFANEPLVDKTFKEYLINA